MVEGKQRNEWNHTSHILALVYNAFRPPRTSALSPNDFNPFTKKQAKTITLKELSELGILKQQEKSHG